MNERIRELAEQAGIATNLDTDYFEKDINKWIDYYSEKFAELIVRECVATMYKHGETYAHPSAGFYQARTFSEAIMEHFGVE